MEVRGGCGYIEDFPDARLVRDAHLGSIWEGTSNIVALDVLRAAAREGSLEALETHLAALRAATADPLPRLAEASEGAFVLARHAGAEGGPVLARQAASALYNVASATTLAWEAERAGLPERRVLAAMVLAHRVLPRDPLCAAAEDIADALLPDPGEPGPAR